MIPCRLWDISKPLSTGLLRLSVGLELFKKLLWKEAAFSDLAEAAFNFAV